MRLLRGGRTLGGSPFPVFTLAVVVCTAMQAEPAGAQRWTVDLHAGRASFETVPTAAMATNATLGLRYAMDRRFLHTSVAAPLSSGDLFWTAAGVGDRFASAGGGSRRDSTSAARPMRSAIRRQRSPGGESGESCTP